MFDLFHGEIFLEPPKSYKMHHALVHSARHPTSLPGNMKSARSVARLCMCACACACACAYVVYPQELCLLASVESFEDHFIAIMFSLFATIMYTIVVPMNDVVKYLQVTSTVDHPPHHSTKAKWSCGTPLLSTDNLCIWSQPHQRGPLP